MRNSRLNRYFVQQRRQGNGFVEACVNLPRDLLAYRRRRAGPGSMIEGYGRYDLPLLASYSRSGTNWIRYVIEYISRRPTPGQVRLHAGDDYIIDRAHQAFPTMHSYKSVILVIRDYRETLLRHLGDEWAAQPDVVAFLESEAPFQRPDWYIRNIEAFDRFQGRRLLLYYEDLIDDGPASVRKLCEFLDLDPARVVDFIDHLDEHRGASVDAYRAGGHDSITGGRRAILHADRLLEPGQAAEFDQYYQLNYPDLYRRYLDRYATTDDDLR